MYQKILFNLEDIFKEPLKKYKMFFSLLDLSCLEPVKHLGRRLTSRAALTRALIFKNLRIKRTPAAPWREFVLW